jgi:hypothetical protein
MNDETTTPVETPVEPVAPNGSEVLASALAAVAAPPPAEDVVEEPAPAPPRVLPTIVHLSTEVKVTFGILDKENNVVHPTPITVGLEKLNAQSLTAVLARVREERQKFAEAAAEAGIV